MHMNWKTPFALDFAVAPALIGLVMAMATTPASANCGNDKDVGRSEDLCANDHAPSLNATPELDSLVLFGTGLAGAGGYVLTRYRARRQHDEHVESPTA